MMRLAVTTVLIWCSVATAAGQTGTSGSKPASPQGKQKSMMQGGMSAMMEHCQMHCRESMTAMSTLSKQVEEARQSKDVTKMRAEMREHMQTCMRNMSADDSKPPSPGGQGGDHQHHPQSTPRK